MTFFVFARDIISSGNALYAQDDAKSEVIKLLEENCLVTEIRILRNSIALVRYTYKNA